MRECGEVCLPCCHDPRGQIRFQVGAGGPDIGLGKFHVHGDQDVAAAGIHGHLPWTIPDDGERNPRVRCWACVFGRTHE